MPVLFRATTREPPIAWNVAHAKPGESYTRRSQFQLCGQLTPCTIRRKKLSFPTMKRKYLPQALNQICSAAIASLLQSWTLTA